MERGEENAYIRYLKAKKAVDDRALDPEVWKAMRRALPVGPVRVLEVGGGIGTMVERAFDWELAPSMDYTLTDVNPHFVETFKCRIGPWCRQRGLFVEEAPEGAIRLRGPSGESSLHTSLVDLTAPRSWSDVNPGWDLIIAHGVMDLVNIDGALEAFPGWLTSGGLVYLSLNYDGETVFLPPWDVHMDMRILERYHASMDARRVHGRATGGSRTGDRLKEALTARRFELLASGRSDWAVQPGRDGYPAGEKIFLDCIVETVYRTLVKDPEIPRNVLEKWLQNRRQRIRSGELSFHARNLDFLASRPSPPDIGGCLNAAGPRR
ncbi:MAG: class I SAM-dependent methyltransferase [Desulfobacterales bacterium]|jgi:hypothetical protein